MGINFNPLPGKHLTGDRERLMLKAHGTQPWTLSPENILQCARRDMRTKADNAEINRIKREAKRSGLGTKGLTGKKQNYSFLPTHVAQAKDAETLLRIALDDRGRGLVHKSPDTVEVYSDPDRLARALLLAIGEGS